MTLSARLQSGLGVARSSLLDARVAGGYWVGELSSSALSTATAVGALAIFQREQGSDSLQTTTRITAGLDWLAANVNPDGGWGDTTLSKSNISTTTLCWAAFAAVLGGKARYASVIDGAERWLEKHAGGLAPTLLSEAIIRRYGEDRTFSVPILTMCALAGRLGEGEEAWAHVIQLPFELAACPPQLFAALRLPVVSYALPALIAMGIAHHRHRPSRNLVARSLRNLTENRVMSVLRCIQPTNGGFLEATPLTSFVTMSLAGSGYVNHPVTRKGVEFLIASARTDGSWPIDTNLATWLTTLATNALGEEVTLSTRESEQTRDWLLGQQYRERHPYTNAAPGGWAWTDLPGGVPDADDTAGALLALRMLPAMGDSTRAARAGVNWLIGLQNRDGGIPTFCRGWGKLAFDQSSADLTAHALRAWAAWLPDLPSEDQRRIRKAMSRGIRFLQEAQQREGTVKGAWKPLWFGDQHGDEEINWTYGTSRVLLSCADLPDLRPQLLTAARWLARAQGVDGSWTGGTGTGVSSIEETALAVEGLAGFLNACAQNASDSVPEEILTSLERGVSWLLERIEDGSWTKPSPIGFYFAKLWYFERLYPVIFTVGALTQAESFFRNQALD